MKNLGIAPAAPLALVLTDRVFNRRVSRVSLSLLSYYIMRYVGFHPVKREHSDKELTVSTLCCVVSELNEGFAGFPSPFGFHPVKREHSDKDLTVSTLYCLQVYSLYNI